MIPVELATARTIAAKKRPFLSPALYALTPVIKTGLNTCATDERWRLYFDPIVLSKWTINELAGVLLHEVSHLLRRHFSRAKKLSADSKLFNIAGDIVINSTLRREGINLPKGVIYPETFNLPNGKMEEEYYIMLKKLEQEKELNLDNSSVCSGKCGSCASGFKDEFENQHEVPGISKYETERIQKVVAKQIMSYSQKGSVSSYWQKWAYEQLAPNPYFNWERVLATTLRSSINQISGNGIYSYSKPSRRQLPNLIMPSMRKPIPNLAVVADTSGSMSDEVLGIVLNLLNKLLKSMNASNGIHLIACDTRVTFNKRISKKAQVEFAGRGSTDLRVGIDAAQKLKPKPDLIVVITDGDTPWPTNPPKNMVVVLTEDWLIPKGIKSVRVPTTI